MTQTSNEQETIQAKKEQRFDLFDMLSQQYATRFTQTPPHVLFDTVMHNFLSQGRNNPANSNRALTE